MPVEKNKPEPHLEAIKLLRIAIENNEKEIERIKPLPQSKKVVKRLEKLNSKLQKGIDTLRKNKTTVTQSAMF